MSKKTHRRPAAFRVEEVEVFVPPAAPDIAAEPVPLPVPRVRAMPDLGRGLALGQHLDRRPWRARQPPRLALALRLLCWR